MGNRLNHNLYLFFYHSNSMPVYRVNFSGQMNIAADNELDAVDILRDYLDSGNFDSEDIYCNPYADVIEVSDDEECDL